LGCPFKMFPRLIVDLGREACLGAITSGLGSSTNSDSLATGVSISGSGGACFSFAGLSSIFFLTLPGKVWHHYFLERSVRVPSS
jgi:hypothetical protein